MIAPLPRPRLDSTPARALERLTRSEQRITQTRRTLARVLHRLESTQHVLDRQTTLGPRA